MSDFITEPERRIPVFAEVDVLVAGGGPAGFASAVSAARAGARTLLVEQTGALGGVATNGLMSHWTGRTKGGIYEEILDRSSAVEFVEDKKADDHLAPRQVIDHEKLKGALLDMLEESGSGLLLYTFAAEPIMQGSRVTGLVTEGKGGRRAIRSKVLVDATGDGDVAARAGVPFHMGREGDGLMQPVTLMLKVSGVDTSKVKYCHGFEDDWQLPAGSIQALARKRLASPAGHVLIYPSTLPGTVMLNMTNCSGIDGTRPEDLTRGERACRAQIGPILDFLREFAPGFEGARLAAASSSLGVRETRHFEGMSTIREDDIASARVFDDWVVANAHFNFDVHNMTGAGLDATGKQKEFRQRLGYTIPYGSLVPKGVDGLLLSGRIISGSHLAHSNYRVMPICANIGQAAGIAAALCAKKGLQPRELKATAVQEVLRGLGVVPAGEPLAG